MCLLKVTILKLHLFFFLNVFYICFVTDYNYFPVGEVLRGDRIVNTRYNVEMNKDKKCEMVCNKKKLSIDESKLVAERIQEEYYVHL